MPAYRDKTTHARLFSVNVQDSDTTVIALAGSSVSNTNTVTPNPMAGPKIWDNVAYMIGITAIAGSYSVQLYGQVNGATYPIARYVSGAAATGRFPMTNLTSTPYTPAPTHIEIDETAAGNISFDLYAVGKAYRGFYPGRSRSGDRTIEGRLIGSTVVTVDATHTLSANPTAVQGGAAGAHLGGLDKIYMWDKACFYMETIATTNGAWTVYIIGEINGQTVVIATSPSVGGATKCAFTSNFFGACPKPTQIIFDETSAGTWTGTIDFIAKAGRGQRIGGR